MSQPVVSVVMITYGHEDYITEAIEGVFKQKTNFAVELIISNDCSPDNSDMVIRSIITKSPKHITVSYTNHVKNLGMISNFRWSLQQAQGIYVAICEGDDYWTDPSKLQKQVDFLNNNDTYSSIAHNCEVIGLESRLFSYQNERTFETNDLLNYRLFHTNTILFKNNKLIKSFPTNILSGDRLLFILISSYGKIFYCNEVMSTYRKNDGGISKNVTYKDLRTDINILHFLRKVNINYDYTKLSTFILYTMKAYATAPLSWIEKVDYFLLNIRCSRESNSLSLSKIKIFLNDLLNDK